MFSLFSSFTYVEHQQKYTLSTLNFCTELCILFNALPIRLYQVCFSELSSLCIFKETVWCRVDSIHSLPTKVLQRDISKIFLSIEVTVLYNLTIDTLLKAYNNCDNKKCEILYKHSLCISIEVL